jgi:hypothetical protein
MKQRKKENRGRGGKGKHRKKPTKRVSAFSFLSIPSCETFLVGLALRLD